MGREIDFVVLKNKKPLFAVECKTGEGSVASNLKYFSARLPIPRYYQVHFGVKHAEIAEYKTEIIPFIEFSKTLGI